MWDLLLDVTVVEGPFLITVYVLAAAAFVYLLGRARSAAWVFTVFALVVTGALLGIALLWVAVMMLDAFGGPVSAAAWFWVPAVFAGILVAIWNLWRSRWWRKLVAVLAIPLFAFAGVLGVNAAYGIDRTLGDLLDIETAGPAPVPSPVPPETSDPAEPLYLTWQPPADLPDHGATGLVPGGIPATASGFDARPAQIYLPPAALVENPPALPLVIMMMGQPGEPDPYFIAQTLDAFAADHAGLAPIALVIDQLGDPNEDPLCLDTARGQVETYVMQDVVPWARANLHVQDAPRSMTVAGYSNGGECAAYFGAKYPEVFGNLIAVSPVEWPGAERNEETLREVFGGVQTAYDAVKPANIMAAKAPYADSVAVFTTGDDDAAFAPGTERLAAAAVAAGMQATFFAVPGAAHDAAALSGGLDEAFRILYPRLGLAAP
ncbi:alpha/beta hydrolase [Agromyces silvae]|uniref:alpha/beta hydrolase n=1 Tax=Agromyces silvae TaxID=3388266 RepID=UPI00280A6DF2|nr:alpha/beta hydrolase-fold protein [Agromyces protaetiae]